MEEEKTKKVVKQSSIDEAVAKALKTQLPNIVKIFTEQLGQTIRPRTKSDLLSERKQLLIEEIEKIDEELETLDESDNEPYSMKNLMEENRPQKNSTYGAITGNIVNKMKKEKDNYYRNISNESSEMDFSSGLSEANINKHIMEAGNNNFEKPNLTEQNKIIAKKVKVPSDPAAAKALEMIMKAEGTTQEDIQGNLI